MKDDICNICKQNDKILRSTTWHMYALCEINQTGQQPQSVLDFYSVSRDKGNMMKTVLGHQANWC